MSPGKRAGSRSRSMSWRRAPDPWCRRTWALRLRHPLAEVNAIGLLAAELMAGRAAPLNTPPVPPTGTA